MERDDDQLPVGVAYLKIHPDMTWMASNLLDDGLIATWKPDRELLTKQEKNRNARVILLTENGMDLIDRWIDAEPL